MLCLNNGTAMSTFKLHDFLTIISALAVQLLLAIVVGALLTSGLYIHRARVRHQRHANMLAWRIHRIADDVDLIGRCLTEHVMAYPPPLRMIRRADQRRCARLDPVPLHDPWVFTLHEQKFKNGPQMDPLDIKGMGQKVSTDDYQHTEQQELKQQMQSFGCDGQDERPQGSDDELNLGTRIIKNASAQRSREITEATDPRSYGIGRVSSTSSDDDEDVS